MGIAISKNNVPIRLTEERWHHISTGHPELADLYFEILETIAVNDIKSVLPYFMKYKNVWTNYDQEADTLYMHFKKPSHADHSEMTEDEIIIRYEKNEIIGITVLNVSKR